MQCTACGRYYRLTVYNQTCYCEDCLEQQDDLYVSQEEIDAESFFNPSGRTLPVFYDDDDSHGF